MASELGVSLGGWNWMKSVTLRRKAGHVENLACNGMILKDGKREGLRALPD